MTDTVALLPDVDALLWEFLGSEAEVTTLVPAARIWQSVPAKADLTDPFVRVRRVGGAPRIDWPLVLDDARVQIDVWGGAKSYANQIAETIRSVCALRLRGAHTDGVVAGVRFGSLIYIPDPDLPGSNGGPRPRYSFDVVLTVKPPASPPAEA